MHSTGHAPAVTTHKSTINIKDNPIVHMIQCQSPKLLKATNHGRRTTSTSSHEDKYTDVVASAMLLIFR